MGTTIRVHVHVDTHTTRHVWQHDWVPPSFSFSDYTLIKATCATCPLQQLLLLKNTKQQTPRLIAGPLVPLRPALR